MEKKLFIWVLITLFINLVFSTESEINEFVYTGFTNTTDITLDGVAETTNGMLRLTNDASNVTGHAFYPSPISFIKNGKVVSFSTCFKFDSLTEDQKLGGHGLAFVMSPTTDFTGASPGRYLGLLNSSTDNSVSNHLLAVEFDAVQDIEFHDIDDNHIGIDINSLTSVASVPASYWSEDGMTTKNITLKDWNFIKVWIDYDSDNRLLNVTVSQLNKKPPKAILSYEVDLSLVFRDSMYVGFSASTGLLASSHYVFGWSFKVDGVADDIDLRKSSSGNPETGIGVHTAFSIGVMVFYFLFVLV